MPNKNSIPCKCNKFYILHLSSFFYVLLLLLSHVLKNLQRNVYLKCENNIIDGKYTPIYKSHLFFFRIFGLWKIMYSLRVYSRRRWFVIYFRNNKLICLLRLFRFHRVINLLIYVNYADINIQSCYIFERINFPGSETEPKVVRLRYLHE